MRDSDHSLPNTQAAPDEASDDPADQCPAGLRFYNIIIRSFEEAS